MQTLHKPATFVSLFPGLASSLTIGNFDGCHLGHQELLKHTVFQAQKLAAKSVVITFDPHPALIFQHDVNWSPLFSARQKQAALAHWGVEAHVVLAFDARISELSALDFLEEIVERDLRCRHLTIGFNFRFGKQRSGNIELLQEFAAQHAFAVSVMPALEKNGLAVSSSQIRQLLSRDGNCVQARSLLGHPHVLTGVVKKGKQLGRSIGIPTLNLHGVEQLIPKTGIYSGYVVLEPTHDNPFELHKEKLYPAVFSIGRRPTVEPEGAPLLVEAHLFADKFGENALYDMDCAAILLDRQRDEVKFPDLSSLKRQIELDIELAQSTLKASDYSRRF